MKPVNNNLSWGEQRILWNDQGKCARAACGSPHDNRRHRDSRLLYCADCAARINDACHESLVTPEYK